MALQELGNKQGILLMPYIGSHSLDELTITATAIDAAGESTSFIGPLYWDTGPGTQHSVSSVTGKIYWTPNNVGAWANAATSVLVGIQDITAGVEDGAYDVSGGMVPGVNPLTVTSVTAVTMTTGTKIIQSGSVIGVVVEMTARGGADSFNPQRINAGGGLPYCAIDVGSGPVKSATMPICLIEADDGAIGWFHQSGVPYADTVTAFNSGSAADEYAMIFQVTGKGATNYLMVTIGEVDAGEAGEVVLYGDPTGTPSVMATYIHDGDTFGVVGATVAPMWVPIGETILEPNTEYAVAYKATTAGNRSIRRITSMGPLNARNTTPFGTTLLGGTRADGTGPFATSTADFPVFGFMFNELDDGVQTGGGGGTTIYNVIGE